MCSVTNCVPVKTITLQQMPKGTGGREALGTGPSAAPPPTLRLPPHPLPVPAALRNTCNPASAVKLRLCTWMSLYMCFPSWCCACKHAPRQQRQSVPATFTHHCINKHELVIAQLEQAQSCWKLMSLISQKLLILSHCICFFYVSHVFLCISVCLCSRFGFALWRETVFERCTLLDLRWPAGTYAHSHTDFPAAPEWMRLTWVFTPA